MRLCSSAPATVLLSRNVIWSWADEANVVLGVKATVTKEQSRSGRTSRHGTRLTFRQQRAALEVTKCPGNVMFGGSGNSQAGATADIDHFFKIKAQTITPMRAEGTFVASRRGHVGPLL